ncbi:transforming growth factor-beta receptor-associated protein 1 [Parasteatoda tepidariorum]|uniref:transforming growth factor-beta receptor-associated protein 1 n=1 Tax=Parasteatoda tepidariorum TaxID=114398 RepID=UPI00077F9107|nr:transforming growth factor-beta receptor-associated protein 1 [Parasteatoda tepidariorum]
MAIKAFDLVPAIERVCWTDKVKTVVECLESCGKNLYIGTQECFVIHYVLEEKQFNEGTILFDSTKKNQKYLEVKKPITLLKALSALNRILLLCDGNLIVLNMFDLEIVPSLSKFKGVSYFCLNENPEASNPFSVEVCVAKKKQLLICHVTDDKMIQLRDISIPEPPLAMAMDGQYVCLALSSKYVVVDTESGYAQELFPYDSNTTSPLVKRITKEEFLLGGPSALGMFVTTAGISERPPLQWGENVISVAYSHPYIVVLSSDNLTVYSILDQQQKQRVTFHGGSCLDNFDGRMFVASSDIICALLPVPWEKQVHALLADKKVSEALELAKYSNKAGLSKEQYRIVLQRIQQQAGFIEFSLLHFDEAKELFQESQLDVRELISLFPDLMPGSSSFIRINPPLHDIGNVLEMCSFDEESVASSRKFLLHYLESIRNSSDAVGCKMEMDTSLLKLYAEYDYPSLLSFLAGADVGCQPKEGVEVLQKYERYHALALFHLKLGDNDLALNVWAKIISGDYSDSLYPGMPHFIDFLCKLSDHLLLWKYVDFILEREQELGVKIFTDRPSSEPSSERLRPDFIVEYLHRYPQALLKYLEHLVLEKKLEKEKFHTHLAVMYMDSVLQILKLPETEQTSLSDARKKLQDHLHTSSIYRVQLLLGKALENQLHKECAILYGKLEEHEKAIKILVHQLQDHEAAEDYCIRMSAGKDKKYRHRLFYVLLSVYLDSTANEKQQEDMLPAAIQLLNSDLAEFDFTKVMQLIPPNWSVAILDQFLIRALRSSLHYRYCCRLQSALSRGENLQVKFSKIHVENTSVLMTEDKLCAACKRSFVEPAFARHSNSSITHIQCAKHMNLSSDSSKSKIEHYNHR